MTSIGFGVLSGPGPNTLDQLWAGIRGRAQVVTGYAVDTTKAVQALQVVSPSAAAWWREHTPRLFDAQQRLMFHKEVCEILVE
jgi:hypothetical protein